jgi:hypothetical protein
METPTAPSPADLLPVPLETVTRRIYLIRGQRVMLSSDLAELYQVEARALVQAVKRNLERFPADFMFQLTDEEYANLKSQNVISSWGGARRATPYAFTEHGVAMLSAVLRSHRAIRMSIVIVRAFVKMREMLARQRTLSARIDKLEAGHREQAVAIGLVAKDVQTLGVKVMKEFRKLRAPRRRKQTIGFFNGDNQA